MGVLLWISTCHSRCWEQNHETSATVLREFSRTAGGSPRAGAQEQQQGGLLLCSLPRKLVFSFSQWPFSPYHYKTQCLRGVKRVTIQKCTAQKQASFVSVNVSPRSPGAPTVNRWAGHLHTYAFTTTPVLQWSAVLQAAVGFLFF